MSPLPLYPPSPTGSPRRFLRLPVSYYLCLSAVFTSLMVLVLLYAALLLACGAGILAVCQLGSPLDQIVLGLPLLLIASWLIANFTSRQEITTIDEDPEIVGGDHPLLFEFTERVCSELGIATPPRVLLNQEPNADALLREHALALGWPLVNRLDLSEFKALVAHELTHFRQPGFHGLIRLGFWFDVMEQAIYGRNVSDRLLERWGQGHMLLAWPALLLRGVLRCVRLLLQGPYLGTFLCLRALRRQAELHADCMAIHLAGSAAVVRLLRQLDRDTQGEPVGLWATHPTLLARIQQAQCNPMSAGRDRRPARLLFEPFSGELSESFVRQDFLTSDLAPIVYHDGRTSDTTATTGWPEKRNAPVLFGNFLRGPVVEDAT